MRRALHLRASGLGLIMGLPSFKRKAATAPMLSATSEVADNVDVVGGNPETNPARPSPAINPTITDAVIARGSLLLSLILACALFLAIVYIYQTRFKLPVLPMPIAVHEEGKFVYTIPAFSTTGAREAAMAASYGATFIKTRFEITTNTYDMDRAWRDGGYLECHTTPGQWATIKLDRQLNTDTLQSGYQRFVENIAIDKQSPGEIRYLFDLVTVDKDKRRLQVIKRVDVVSYSWREEVTDRINPLLLCNAEGWIMETQIPGTRQ